MSKYIPQVGHFFYVRSKRTVEREMNTPFGVVVERVTSGDRSWSSTIFVLAALDDMLYVGDIVYGSVYNTPRITICRDQFDAYPVGPDIVAALDLEAARERLKLSKDTAKKGS